MFTTYVIRSAHGLRYTGSTEDLAKRLRDHNSGISKYTSRDTGWHLVYTEEFQTRREAEHRERWLKSGVGRKFLDKIEAISSSGS